MKAGITSDRKAIGQYIEIDGNPNVLNMEHRGDEHKGQVIYLISEQGGGCGFCAEVKCLLEQLLWAERYGFTPKVQYGDGYAYSDKGINGFEQFFKPIGNGVDDTKAMNILLSKQAYIEDLEKNFAKNGYSLSSGFTDELCEIASKYLNIKRDLKERFDREFSEMFDGEKVLGVHYRGSDYKVGYNDHPKMATIEQTEEQINIAMQTMEFERIFLATDDSNAKEYFQNKYRDTLKVYDDVQRTDSDTSVIFGESDRENHKYKLGFEILRDVYSLSLCEGLVGGVSQVTYVSSLFKKARGDDFDYKKIIDNGVNRNRKNFRPDR